MPGKVMWSGTDSGSGIARYQLQRSVNAGSYQEVSLGSVSATRQEVGFVSGSRNRFRVRGYDRAGNVSAWRVGPESSLSGYQETNSGISYSSGWSSVALSGSYGGSVRHASKSSTKASHSFTGRSMAWVSTRGSNRGKAEVWLDGVKVATVDLYSSVLRKAQLVYARGVEPSRSHVLGIRVLGTSNPASTASRVDLDGFIVLK